MSNIKVALVDDHILLRKALANLLKNSGYIIHSENDNGKQLINCLDKKDLPRVILMDINMPEMDGFETTLWLKKHFPAIDVLALSMYDDENAVIRMLRCGVKGYILKDSEPAELKNAINTVVSRGFYYSETVTGRLVHAIQEPNEEDSGNNNRLLSKLTEKEIEFLKLACSEMTYREIAECMYLSHRTIDGYRDQLFEKLNIKSRVGLVLFAIKNGIVRFQ